MRFRDTCPYRLHPCHRSVAQQLRLALGWGWRDKRTNERNWDPLKLSRSRSPSSQFSAWEEGVSPRLLLWELGSKEGEPCVFSFFFPPSKLRAAYYSQQILRASICVLSRVPSCTLSWLTRSWLALEAFSLYFHFGIRIPWVWGWNSHCLDRKSSQQKWPCPAGTGGPGARTARPPGWGASASSACSRPHGSSCPQVRTVTLPACCTTVPTWGSWESMLISKIPQVGNENSGRLFLSLMLLP